MQKIELEISFFGAFRKYERTGPLRLTLAAGAGMTAVKAAIAEALDPAASDLLKVSALADAQQVLSSAHVFESSAQLVLLPPVSGG
ncbi:MAG: hypothetical protein AAGC58_06430 [Asticcacaulis sp.]